MKTIKIGSRDKKVLHNSFLGVVASIVSLFSTYAARVVFARVFGDEIYGINSVFASIVSALLIVELGISAAMVIFLYKPVAENDHETIKTILCLYKKLYRVICLVIFSAGLLIDIAFLPFFVHSDISMLQVRLYFLLYLCSILAKYLWSYKRCILYASNQNKKSSIFSAIVDFTFMILELACIVLLKNYVVYLVVFIFHNMGANILCNVYVDRHYPFVKEKNVVQPTAEDRKRVLSIVKPMFVQRLSNQVQDSSVSIIYSLLGTNVAQVGYFANYILVIHAVETLFNQIALAITSSFGCSFVTENEPEEMFGNYRKSRFFMTTISTILVGCYACFITPFIQLFFGEDFLLSKTIILLTSLYLFMLLTNEVNKSIQNALGIHSIDTVYMVLQTIIGIGLSVLAGIFWSLEGILLGSILAFFIFSGINKGRLIYKTVFRKSGLLYCGTYFLEYLVSGALIIAFYSLFNLVPIIGIWQFIMYAAIMFVIIAFVSSAVYYGVYRLLDLTNDRKKN